MVGQGMDRAHGRGERDYPNAGSLAETAYLRAVQAYDVDHEAIFLDSSRQEAITIGCKRKGYPRPYVQR